MSHTAIIQLTAIVVFGGLAQWIAWRIRLPSILLLLSIGIMAGPLTGWLHPDRVFGDLLLPIVSLSVAVILYEGGLNLRIRELSNVGGVLFLLLTAGTAITLLIGAVAARYLLGFSWPVAALLGSILVVTGPTVIGPLLRHLHLRGKIATLLKWEGIIIDPIGAVLSLLVFTVVQAGALQVGVGQSLRYLGLTMATGLVLGGLAAGVLILAMRRFWIPDHLHNPGSLMLIFAAFTTANMIQEESGLLAVTVMGIALANQKWVSIRHIVEFKETLTVLLVSALFIILAARLQPEDLRGLDWKSIAFVCILIFVARPAAVTTSTLGSSLTWRERVFLSCMAPRGIVAAAISSVFALQLAGAGYPRALEIVPIVFFVVLVTVLFYGLTSSALAKTLGLVQTNPQGVLFVGADAGVRAMASALQEEGCSVFLLDTNRENVQRARMEGLPCMHGSALAMETRETIDYSGLGRMLAMTLNHEVNSLCCLSYIEDFGRQEVYQLPFPSGKEGRHVVVAKEHHGRHLFSPRLTFNEMQRLMTEGAKVKKTKLTKEFDYQAFQAQYNENAIPLFVLRPKGVVQVSAINDPVLPLPNDVLISFVLDSHREKETPNERMEYSGA